MELEEIDPDVALQQLHLLETHGVLGIIYNIFHAVEQGLLLTVTVEQRQGRDQLARHFKEMSGRNVCGDDLAVPQEPEHSDNGQLLLQVLDLVPGETHLTVEVLRQI